MNQKAFRKILIVRNDKLGDFMLAYPSFALLKENFPDVRLYALISSYTEPMAEVCPWIDKILLDPAPKGKWTSGLSLSKHFLQEQFDAIVTLYSTSRVGLAARCANIPYRLAPSTKLAQIYYNHRFIQRRSRSEKPEFIYNQDLVRYFLRSQAIPITKEPTPPYLHFDKKQIKPLKAAFCKRQRIKVEQPLIFIHPGSGGSAGNLSIEQFASLARGLRSKSGHHVVITAGPEELHRAEAVGILLSGLAYSIYHSTEGLLTFAQHIQFADLFISGSTGPLHIAGALDIPTVGFYTRRRSASSLRWQTLNSSSNRLSFSPEKGTNPEDMERIDVGKAARIISERFLLESNS